MLKTSFPEGFASTMSPLAAAGVPPKDKSETNLKRVESKNQGFPE